MIDLYTAATPNGQTSIHLAWNASAGATEYGVWMVLGLVVYVLYARGASRVSASR